MVLGGDFTEIATSKMIIGSGLGNDYDGDMVEIIFTEAVALDGFSPNSCHTSLNYQVRVMHRMARKCGDKF